MVRVPHGGTVALSQMGKGALPVDAIALTNRGGWENEVPVYKTGSFGHARSARRRKPPDSLKGRASAHYNCERSGFAALGSRGGRSARAPRWASSDSLLTGGKAYGIRQPQYNRLYSETMSRMTVKDVARSVGLDRPSARRHQCCGELEVSP